MSKSGFGSSDSISASGGASGGSDQQSERGAVPAVKTQRPRVRIQDIVPCNVNQLLSSTVLDTVFKVRGITVSQVSIVGIIRGAEKASNHICYKIDDMTAKPIEARQWFGREKVKQLTPLSVGLYVKVFGILKCPAGTKSLEVLKIYVLEDMNEFTVHILESVNAHMMLDKARGDATVQSVPVSASEVDDAGDNDESRRNFIRDEVLRLIQECPRLEGRSIHEIHAQLCHLGIQAIKEVIDYLTLEGHIYPTVDREHFKSAD
ncbi:replication protein A 30 kDa subunit [Saimiri boliviensis]|uniref:replication protein A 30 kDa subunit n=1 Tax=Saimiri boliviensis TaxID=27679 RepID=UPI00027FB42E|nr:replication protein A 30 kDa subunit [Saimiri boliviensis boliviensis]